MKTYFFSMSKYARDIEFYYTRINNIIMEGKSSNINQLYQEKAEVVAILYAKRNVSGTVAYLTGAQIGKAKEIVLWANTQRGS